MAYFNILFQNLPGGTEENYEKPQSEWPVLTQDLNWISLKHQTHVITMSICSASTGGCHATYF
jgi:hypothetical protein